MTLKRFEAKDIKYRFLIAIAISFVISMVFFMCVAMPSFIYFYC